VQTGLHECQDAPVLLLQDSLAFVARLDVEQVDKAVLAAECWIINHAVDIPGVVKGEPTHFPSIDFPAINQEFE
jgi:hypothetical protein